MTSPTARASAPATTLPSSLSPTPRAVLSSEVDAGGPLSVSPAPQPVAMTTGPNRATLSVPTAGVVVSLGAAASTSYPGWTGGTWEGVSVTTTSDVNAAAKNVRIVTGATGGKEAVEGAVGARKTLDLVAKSVAAVEGLVLSSLEGSPGMVALGAGLAAIGSPAGGLAIGEVKALLGMSSEPKDVRVHAEGSVVTTAGSIDSSAMWAHKSMGMLTASLTGGASVSVTGGIVASMSALYGSSVKGMYKAGLIAGLGPAIVSSRWGTVELTGPAIHIGKATSDSPRLLGATTKVEVEAAETVRLQASARTGVVGSQLTLTKGGASPATVRVSGGRDALQLGGGEARLLVGSYAVSVTDDGIQLFKAPAPIPRVEQTIAAASAARAVAVKAAEDAFGVLASMKGPMGSEAAFAATVAAGFVGAGVGAGVGAAVGGGTGAGIGTVAGIGAGVLATQAVAAAIGYRAGAKVRDAAVKAADTAYQAAEAGAEAAEKAATSAQAALAFPAISLGDGVKVKASPAVSLTLTETSLVLKAGTSSIELGPGGITIDTGMTPLTLKAGGNTFTLGPAGLQAPGIQALP